MKPYKNYKNSGIEWIGNIPEHWETFRIKSILESEINGIWGEESIHDGDDVICVRVADYDKGFDNLSDKNNTIRKIAEKDYEKRKLDEDDLLIEKSGGGELSPVGRVGIYTWKSKRAVCSNFMARLRFNKIRIVERYVFYTFKIMYAQKINQKSIKQTTGIQNLDTSSYFNECIPIPPFSEQQQIASYLDKKCSEIDSLIEKKQRIIELLCEERSAVINHAVTRGLNPNTKLKNSGIEWIGNIPEHWGIKKLKYLVQINPKKRNYEFSKDSEVEVVFLPMERVSENGIIDQSVKKPINEISSGFTYFEKGDILIAKITPCFENGKGALLVTLETSFGFGSTEFHTLRTDQYFDKYFLFHVSKSSFFRKIAEAFMSGTAGQKRVPTDFIENFLIPIPPLSEQQQISSCLDKKCSEIDSLIEKEQRFIELLQEYRTVLISRIVTGKAKVIQ
jgi:type I restriction enzyme S subunit